MKYFRVFNVDQIEGLPEYMTTKPEVKFSKKGEKNETAEQMISNTSFVQITEKDVNKAFYNPARDFIVIPKNFKSWEGMYETFFHEIAHSTGHINRLNRPDKFKDSKKSYAFEELVAELTSAYICAYCGIEKNITNNAAYIDSWLKALQDDKTFIFKASTEAGKAANYILNKTIQPVESVE
jgi:antirestriction protein ArdC